MTNRRYVEIIAFFLSVILSASMYYVFPAMEVVLTEEYYGIDFNSMLPLNLVSSILVVLSYWYSLRLVEKIIVIDLAGYDFYFFIRLYIIKSIYIFLGASLLHYAFEELGFLILIYAYFYYAIEILYLSYPSWIKLGRLKCLAVFSLLSLIMAGYFEVVDIVFKYIISIF